jgi:hypothetical protein
LTHDGDGSPGAELGELVGIALRFATDTGDSMQESSEPLS